MRELVAILAIVALCVFGAIVYGVIHDQVTVRVCLEYFTIGHPPVFDTDNPTLLAFGWGVIATWWAGAILGVPIALCSRAGRFPRRSPSRLVGPLIVMLVAMGVTAAVSGMTGYELAKRGKVQLIYPLDLQVPRDKHAAFLADLWSHLASYAGGVAGTAVLCVWIMRKRRAERARTG